MAAIQDTFILRLDFYPQVKMLSREQRGDLLTAIFAYSAGEELPELDAVTAMCFGFIRIYIDEYWRSIEPLRARRSAEYARWRREVLQRDGYACRVCGRRDGELHVHHLIPFAESVELRTEVSNGITLCAECHRRIHQTKITL